MDKQKLTREDRTEFILKFENQDFTIDDVVAYLEDKIVLDDQKIRKNAMRSKARQLVSGFKDADGVRLIAAYDASADNEPCKMAYRVIDKCNDPKVLDKQIINMTKNRDGSEKLIKKATERKKHLADQADLFNYSEFEDEEEAK